MDLLELAKEINLLPKRVASTNGGEYHSPCPQCAGKDRFIIQPGKDRYFCRQCEARGDSIQFCRDFMKMSYQDACKKLSLECKVASVPKMRKQLLRFLPEVASVPPVLWQNRAAEFTIKSHCNLLKNLTALDLMQRRGLSLETIKTFALGWNPINEYLFFDLWGLPQKFNEMGNERKLWLPKGLVIPTFLDSNVAKLKVRRSDWEEGDSWPKYVEISGSMKVPSLYGEPGTRVVVLVEAEFDAMLIQQFASDLCCCMAVGGVSKKPDLDSHRVLLSKPVILFALDFDEAGKKAFRFWRSTYPHLKAWPVPKEKSPGDAYQKGVNLREWIASGIRHLL